MSLTVSTAPAVISTFLILATCLTSAPSLPVAVILTNLAIIFASK